ncbi:MAG: hypothetical protein JSU96_17710 [Acidobacteriota bacterium]|nr:MAG: hypothetical protein JSU96_17710 [Acidobacteriota bacterium]
MSSPRTPVPAVPKKRGCLRGCLILLLVCAILGVGLGVAGYLLLVPYLQEKSAELQVEYPWLGPAWEVLSDLVGGQHPEILGSSSSEKGQGASDRSLLPADIPVLERPYREGFSITSTEIDVYQISLDSQEFVTDYFTENFKRYAWQSGRTPAAGGTTWSWSKAESACILDVLEIENRVEVFLRCRIGDM